MFSFLAVGLNCFGLLGSTKHLLSSGTARDPGVTDELEEEYESLVLRTSFVDFNGKWYCHQSGSISVRLCLNSAIEQLPLATLRPFSPKLGP